MTKLRQYAIAIVIGLIFLSLCFFIRDTFSSRDRLDIIKDCTDGFFASGVIVTGFGLLIMINNNGMFDMAVFSARKIYLNFKFKEDKRLSQSLFDYKQEKEASEQPEFGHFLIVGGVFILISVLILFLYYK